MLYLTGLRYSAGFLAHLLPFQSVDSAVARGSRSIPAVDSDVTPQVAALRASEGQRCETPGIDTTGGDEPVPSLVQEMVMDLP
jgi:hypothetical protein